MIAYLNNRSPLRLVQACEYRAEEEGDEEAGEEESGGKPEDGFAEARSDFAGFGILRIASPRAETRTEVVGVDKTRGNHCAGDGKGPGFMTREGDEPWQGRERGSNGGSEPCQHKQGRQRAAKQRPTFCGVPRDCEVFEPSSTLNGSRSLQ